MKTPSLSDLVAILHSDYLTCGEIRTSNANAEMVQEYETLHGVELTPEQVLASVRQAAELFVDSMQENAAANEPDIRRWEAQRPSVIHRAQLETLLRQS